MSEADRQPMPAKVLQGVLIAGAAYFVVAYLVIVACRITYPYELEWCEGCSVDQIQRILDGRGIYVAPNAEFVPFMYPPIYFYLSALVAKATGVGFLPLRLVSFVAWLLGAGVLFEIVRRETKNLFASFLAAGLYAATFRAAGGWFDVARIDSLFMLFYLLTLFAIRFSTTWRGMVLAGVFLAISFLTKQTALMMAPTVFLWCLAANPRRGWVLIGTFAAVSGAAILLMNSVTEGWYCYWTFTVPSGHPWVPRIFRTFWTRDFTGTLPVACTIAAVWFAFRIYDKKEYGFWLGAFLGMVGGAYLSKLHLGGYDNVLIPAYAAVSILFGLGIDTVQGLARTPNAAWARPAELALYAACIIQFGILVYDPSEQVPTQADRVAGDQLVQMIAKADGDVHIPRHGYLAKMAGKNSCAHQSCINALFQGPDHPAKGVFAKSINEARARGYGLVIVDEMGGPDLEKDYQFAGMIFPDERIFLPVSGANFKPRLIFIPKRSWPPYRGPGG